MRDGEDKTPGVAMLAELRPALLDLHKTLLDWERIGYERAHGRQSSGELLQLLLSNPQFSWLHSISELIVRIDEALEPRLEAAVRGAQHRLGVVARPRRKPADPTRCTRLLRPVLHDEPK